MDRNLSLCDKIENYLINYRKWSVWRVIILGQILSILLCALTYMTHLIASEILLNIPTGQSYLHYMQLCAVFTTILACRKGEMGLISVIKTRGYRYILIGFIDVQANTLLATAHQFTTLNSIHLLDCISIPVSLALSCLTLGIRFRFVHILGVSICLLGIGCLIWADIGANSVIDSQNQLIGDMLCLGGAVLFAVVAVLQELVVKTLDCIEYLGMLGLCGSIICGIQTFLLEKNTLTNVNWENKSVLLYLGCFSLAQFIFYGLMAYVLKESGATSVQLYLLTADFYSLLLGIFWKTVKFHALYFLSYLLIMTGIYIFAIKKTTIPTNSEENHHSQQVQQQYHSYNDGITVALNDETNINYLTPDEYNNSNNIIREYAAVPYLTERFELNSTDVASEAVLADCSPKSDIHSKNNTGFSSFYGK